MFKQNYNVNPRHVICVLGSGLDLDVVEEVVARVGGPGFVVDQDSYQRTPDPRMPRSFAACLFEDTFTESDHEAVETHDSVAYVLSPPMPLHVAFDPRQNVMVGQELDHRADGLPWGEVFDISRRMLEVAGALLRSGATAVKNESSGLTHGRDQWLFTADRAAGAENWQELAVDLYGAWVTRPLRDGNLVRSLGMHLLGAPDVELQVDWPRELTRQQFEESVNLIDNLAFYLLGEDRALDMVEGEGFRLSPDGPRWVLERHPCLAYEEESFRYNPYGYWRLVPDV